MKAKKKIFTVIVLLALAAGFIYGRDAFWELLGGNPDLGPVDFVALKPPTTPNNFLVCPEMLCKEAQADMTAPTYELSAEQLQSISREVWSKEPRSNLVGTDTNPLRDRYVQRTPVMRFPDTISVRFVELGENRSSLAIYSRSQIGRSDFGVNRRRVMRWISALERRLAR